MSKNPRSVPKILASEVRQALKKLVASPTFASSNRLCRFLQFTVDRTLKGEANSLKETSIGVHVYDRDPAYDRSNDSIVRTESGRLREKLRKYYASHGKDDPIIINFRPGSYVPVFQRSGSVALTTIGPTRKAEDALPSTEIGIAIAIVPIVDLSASPLSAQCAKGLTEELLHGWMHAPGVRVAAPSVVTACLQENGFKRLAKELAVRMICEGSVWEENQWLRVTLRLINADGFHVWSQRFEASANMHGLFMLTKCLASAVISRSRPESSTLRKLHHPMSEPTLATLPVMLGAEALLDEGTTTSLEAARLKFDELTHSLPDSARPLCGLAQCFGIAALRGVAECTGLLSQAHEAANRAVELDPEMIMARASLAYVRGLEWAWAEAERHFQAALAMGSHPAALREYALYLVIKKHFDGGEHFLEQAQQIDPFSGRQKVCCARFYYYTRRYEEAQKYVSEQSEFGIFPVEARLHLARCLLLDGRQDEAKVLALGSRRDAAMEPNLMAVVAEVMSYCGALDQAQWIINQFRLFASASPISFCQQALLSMSLGQTESALSYLLKARAKREPELIWLNVEPRFDPVRSESRFNDILADVLPEVSQ